jgi:hypothetical protein
MTLQPSAPHKRQRWLALFAIVILATGAVATSALAAPTFTFVQDTDGLDDEPGQKDLTAQATAFDFDTNPDDFYVAWRWDETSWSGKNTGDACALFDSDANGSADFAVCVTVSTSSATELSTRVYTCTDGRPDRCTGSALSSAVFGDVCQVTHPAGLTGDADADTQATCNVSAIGISALSSATHTNSCSYPSEQPNSDPSDCVITIPNLNTSVSTLSAGDGTPTWSVTLKDTATLSPTSATGNVVFKLWSDAACTTLVWESASVAVGAGGIASTVGAGTVGTGSRTITNLTVDSDGVYYWTVDYTPSGAFNPSAAACGEATTITPASVAGSSG